MGQIFIGFGRYIDLDPRTLQLWCGRILSDERQDTMTVLENNGVIRRVERQKTLQSCEIETCTARFQKGFGNVECSQ